MRRSSSNDKKMSQSPPVTGSDKKAMLESMRQLNHHGLTASGSSSPSGSGISPRPGSGPSPRPGSSSGYSASSSASLHGSRSGGSDERVKQLAKDLAVKLIADKEREWKQKEAVLAAEIQRYKSKLLQKDTEDTRTASRSLQRGRVKKSDKKDKKGGRSVTSIKVSVRTENVMISERLADTGGSGATVYACSVDGWSCVMKELNMGDMAPEALQAFEHEVELFEELPFHPNLCRYLFHDTHDGKIRLFLSRYSCSLEHVLKERRRAKKSGQTGYFSVGAVARYALDIIRGLEFLHERKVMHRDMKPGNVFCVLNELNEIRSLALGDLDTAKKISLSTAAQTLTGTPGYIAPEVLQAAELGQYSYKADVYSFGMVLYEIISLKQPFEDAPYFDLYHKIVKGERPPVPDDLDKHKYRALLETMDACTQHDPKRRPDPSMIKERLILLATQD